MTNLYRALCAEVLTLLDLYEDGDPYVDWDVWKARARALLAEPEAVGPTDEELLASVRHLYGDQTAADMGAEDDLRTARAVLARYGRPAAAPVPVSERVPGPEDCDAEGRCWLGGHQMGSGTPTWLLGYPAWAERFPDVHHFWLPVNALPLPAPEVQL